MAIYLSRKKGGTVATPITPSNANPAQMTANTPVTPTANGYAIENYLDVYPDNDDPVQIASDGVAVFKGAGIVIEDAPITAIPNDNNPPELDEDRIYIIRNNTGYLYETQPAAPTSITPNDSSPVALSANVPVNPTTSGYAIKNAPASKTPSDSSPASVSSGAIIKNGGSSTGYLYASSGLVNMVNITNTASKDTNFTLSSGSTTSVSVTSKPRLILWFQGNYGSSVSAGYGEMGMYDGINNRYRRVTFYSGGANTATDSGDISSVTSSTVSFKNNGTTSRRYHVMMWY